MNEKTLIEKLLKFMKEMKDVLQKKAPEGVDPDKPERCVRDVKDQGHSIGSAHAICTASMKKEESSDFDDEIIKYDSNGQWQITKKNNKP